MATIKTFEDIESWKLARKLCKKTGELIDSGRFKKSFRLIDQIDGSSGSVMDNIAEGFERGTRKEFILFLGYAKGSCGEFRSQLYRALDRGYISEQEFEAFASDAKQTSGLIQKFIEYLNKSEVAGTRKNVKP
ncbi:MAG: four helix bundle protein [Chitinophagaceae bacterium]|jgi:four helix bundle protein|nr:four helix bundle protein [Chitinophagaceae bacterium]